MVDGINIVDGYEVLYSLNGKKYHPYGYFANENANEDSNATSIKSCGLVGKNARYVKIILHTRDIGSISEVEIFGYPLTEEYDSVPVNITMKNFLLGYIDWSSYIGEAKSFGLYIEKFNFDNIEGLEPKAVYDSLSPEYKNRYCEYQPFEPETTYYIAITTTDKNGVEEKAVKPLKITTQSVVGDAPKDVFALNYYTSEFGSADQVHGSYQTEHEDNMIKLIDELNFNKNRWWRHYETELSRFAKIGMSYAVQSATGTDYVKSDNALGTWTYGQGNESDLHGTDTNAYLNELKQTYNIAKNLDKRNVVEAPALGGTEPASVKWLENLYKTDGVDGKKVNQYFDYLDFHAYCKIMDEQVEGLPTCVPEQIYKKLDDLRAVMTKYGDGDKPLVATELGWSTFEGRHYLIPVDYETQRDYLTRLYLIFISEGVREGYLYNFQNSGIDPKNFEHNIGIVDWFGVPKPAYYGLYTLSKVMQNVTFVRSLDEIKNPYYGMTFWDNAKGQYMTSLWSADNQTKTATLFVPGNDENVMILGTDGSYTSKKVVNNKVNVTISGAPIFVYSDEAATVEEMTVPFAVDNIKLDALRGETATFNIKRGKTGAGLSGELSAEMPKDFALEGELSFNETTENIPITISVPSGAEEIEQSLVVNIRLSDGSTLPINLTINVTKSMEISFFASIFLLASSHSKMARPMLMALR
ncbi:MAG: hypothetical protein RSC29_02480, partial [Oscillospiraceae bacterium]